MNPLYLSIAAVTCYGVTDANNDAFIPEMWANEGLMILEENMVMANLVYRDFENEVKSYGDVVNTRRPGTFTASRKVDGDTLVAETAASTNVRVPLDQWFYKNFVIKDGEASLSFQDLVEQYLIPAATNLANDVDRAVLGRIHEYLTGTEARAGKLGGLTPETSYDYVLEARQRLNDNLAPQTSRKLVLSSASETALLKNTMFVKASERGDGGSALENAILGRIAGFDTLLDQNVPSVLAASADTDAGTVTAAYAAGYAGAQLSVLAGVVAGEFMVVAGNDQPTWVVTPVEATSFVLNEANKYATLDDAVCTHYKKCDAAAAYGVGYSKRITLENHGANKGPQRGQLLAFGTGAGRRTYTVIERWAVSATSTAVLLDRPLDVAVGSGDDAFPGPAGAINWAFHREAIALVCRPLALPRGDLGVMAKVVNKNGVSMRVTAQYDIDAGGTKVNLDLLCGVAVLDTRLCVPLLG